MSRKIKYVGLVVLAVILFTAVFVGGFYVGNKRAVNSTSMTLVGSTALDNRTVLKMLEKGDIDAAKKYLNSALDAEIMELYALRAASSDTELRNRILNTLITIAKDRRDHQTDKNHAIGEVDQKVQSILDSVLADKKD